MPIITAQAPLPSSQPVPSVRQLDKSVPSLEAASEATPVAVSEEKELDPKFAVMARKEKALRSKYQELKSQEDALKAKAAEYETSYISKQALSERLQRDPFGFMAEQGLTYDQLTNFALNPNSQTEVTIQKLEAKIKELEEKQTKTSSRFDEEQQKAVDQAVKEIRNETKILISSDERFETIKEQGAEEAVVELIRETYEKQGLLLSVDDAAKEVEEFLVEEGVRLSNLKKVQARLKPPAPLEVPKQMIPAEKQIPPMRTLTNAQVAPSSKGLSDKERKARAIAAFRGQTIS